MWEELQKINVTTTLFSYSRNTVLRQTIVHLAAFKAPKTKIRCLADQSLGQHEISLCLSIYVLKQAMASENDSQWQCGESKRTSDWKITAVLVKAVKAPTIAKERKAAKPFECEIWHERPFKALRLTKWFLWMASFHSNYIDPNSMWYDPIFCPNRC